jgi:hypothetical protein
MNGTDFRIFYEQYGIYKLSTFWKIPPTEIIHQSKILITSDYDLEYKDIKFDVKYSHPVIYAKGKQALWDFNLRKTKNNKRMGQDKKYCDYFILIGMANGIPKKTFLIPIDKAPTNHIRISIYGQSKYHKYEI